MRKVQHHLSSLLTAKKASRPSEMDSTAKALPYVDAVDTALCEIGEVSNQHYLDTYFGITNSPDALPKPEGDASFNIGALDADGVGSRVIAIDNALHPKLFRDALLMELDTQAPFSLSPSKERVKIQRYISVASPDQEARFL